MTSLTPLRDALLELGLEDLIPLPEILATPEVNELSAEYRHIENVSAALIELLREMRRSFTSLPILASASGPNICGIASRIASGLL
jgi:hypothetical protein